MTSFNPTDDEHYASEADSDDRFERGAYDDPLDDVELDDLADDAFRQVDEYLNRHYLDYGLPYEMFEGAATEQVPEPEG